MDSHSLVNASLDAVFNARLHGAGKSLIYEAAARVVTAADQALDTLINRTGIVGR